MQGFIRELALAALFSAVLIGGALVLHYADILVPAR